MHGLSHFCYTYPECQLRMAYDLYETPDGKQTLIDEVAIYAISEGSRSFNDTYVDEDSPWGYFLDREDWGLAFTVQEATDRKITLGYTQQQSLEAGELSLEGYLLYPTDEETGPENRRMVMDGSGLPVAISSDGTGSFTLSWEEPLKPGAYCIKLTVADYFDPDALHPLLDKFYDKQSYAVDFTVSD